MNEFDRSIEEIRKEITGKVIAIPGHVPVGRVIKVDEEGAWLDEKTRITPLGLVFYHPVKEDYQVK